VAIHDVGVHAGQVFVAMEFVVGRTMRQWWEEHEPDWQEVLAAMVQAGRGIIAAHAAGLVHRDIKPDNLLIGDDGRVRVADFGIARHAPNAAGDADPDPSGSGRELATIGERGALIGTPAYMPPEQHDGGEVGPHSDQFSFCVTLWEGLFGQRPFVGEAAKLPGIIRAGVPTRPEGAPELPAWLAQAVRRGSPRASRTAGRRCRRCSTCSRSTSRRGGPGETGGCSSPPWPRSAGWRWCWAGARCRRVWARAAAERAAAARLVGVGASVERLLARDLRDEAEETLRAFVEEPELRDTRAAIDAWLLWADHMEARSDRAAAQAAVVEAYTALPPDDPREPAIALRIAQQFRGAWKFAELAALGDQVAQRWPDAAHTAAWTRLRAEAALARGDLAGFLAQVDAAGAPGEYEDIAPALRALASASCPLRDEMLVYPTDWPGNPGPELLTIQKDGITIRRMDAALTPSVPGSMACPCTPPTRTPEPLVRVPGGPAYLIGHAHPPIKEISLIELGDAGPREVLRWPRTAPAPAPRPTSTATACASSTSAPPPTPASCIASIPTPRACGSGAPPTCPPTRSTATSTRSCRRLQRRRPRGAGRGGRGLARLRRPDLRGRAGRRAADRRPPPLRPRDPDGGLRAADGQTLLALAKDETARSKEAWPPGRATGRAGRDPHRPPQRRHARAGGPLPVAQQAHCSGPAARPRAHGRRLRRRRPAGRRSRARSIGAPFVTSMLLRQLPDGSFARGDARRGDAAAVGNFDDDPADELLAHGAPRRDDRALRARRRRRARSPEPAPHAQRRTPRWPTRCWPARGRWPRTSRASASTATPPARSPPHHPRQQRGRPPRAAAPQRRALRGGRRAVQAGRALRGAGRQGDVAAALRAVANFEQALRMPEALRVVSDGAAPRRPDAGPGSELRLAHAAPDGGRAPRAPASSCASTALWIRRGRSTSRWPCASTRCTAS
jgi:hypothetical protein